MLPIIQTKTINNQAQTLESLIEHLDQRGILVFQVLLGQQAMKLLEEKHTADVTKPSVLKPTKDI